MIKIPPKGKNNIKYSEKLAQKTDYVVIVNDDESSNVSDLFIIWNQKARVVISSYLKDFYLFLKETKATSRYNFLIIGSSKSSYLEIEKHYMFLKFYFFLKDKKILNNLRSRNKNINSIRLFSKIAYLINENNKKNEDLIKFIEVLEKGNYEDIYKAYLNLDKKYSKKENYLDIINLSHQFIYNKKKLNDLLDKDNVEDFDIDCYIKLISNYNLIPFKMNIYLSNIKEKDKNKIIEILDDIIYPIKFKKDIEEIENLKEGSILNKYNTVIYKILKNKENIYKYLNKELNKNEVRELKNIILTRKEIKEVERAKEKTFLEIYNKMRLNRSLDKDTKEFLLGFISYLEVRDEK